MTTDIMAELKRIAPSIAVTVTRKPDPYYQWDGEGDDPVNEGFTAYIMTVTASAVMDGKLTSGKSYLGGTYYRDDEPIGDINGYLPQMVIEALRELLKLNMPEQVKEQAYRAISHIKYKSQ